LANVYGEFGLNRFLDRAMKAGIPTPPFRLNPDIARAHVALYADSNRELAKRLGVGDPEEMFPVSDLSGTSPGADFSGHLPIDTVVQLMSLLIREHEERYAELSARIAACEAAKPS
jgi:hypothetical protein